MRIKIARMQLLLIASALANWALGACLYLAVRDPTSAEIKIEHVQHFRVDTRSALIHIRIDRPAPVNRKKQAQTTDLVLTPRALLEMRHGINVLLEAIEQKRREKDASNSTPNA